MTANKMTASAAAPMMIKILAPPFGPPPFGPLPFDRRGDARAAIRHAQFDVVVHGMDRAQFDLAFLDRLPPHGLAGVAYQVEHHLLPRVCHLHYPALARIVEETCRTHRVRYRCEPTLRSALAANWRWLRRMPA